MPGGTIPPFDCVPPPVQAFPAASVNFDEGFLMTLRRSVAWMWITCLSCLAAAPAAAQVPNPAPAEAAELGAGWSALAAGQTGSAAAIAATAIGKYPRSLGAATLFIQTEALRSGAIAGLSAYEQWLGGRSLEDPFLVRVVALGFLREAVRVTPAGDAQRLAFQALSLDGDAATLAALAQTTPPNGVVEMQMLGAMGNEGAVLGLVAILREILGDRTRIINALRDTRSPRAAQALIEVLSDQLPSNRMAAADALGQMGATVAIDRLRGLLTDHQSAVRLAAARALFRLRDPAGTPLLRELENSEYSMVRAQALEATAGDADQTWLNSVRRLLGDPDPLVRLLAAKLIAPHDAAAAEAAVRGLMNDSNIAVQEVANQTLAEVVATDWPTLRRYLRSSDPVIRTAAAARILDLTR